MMNYYYSKGSFTISELIEVSEFSRPTVTNTVLEAVNMGYLEELPDKIDRRVGTFDQPRQCWRLGGITAMRCWRTRSFHNH